ncbi:MAG: hypothetical protein ABMA15_10395 [Vicinamibacterales bacterium]
MVDPGIRFDHIHIIESLPEPGYASKTGRRLFERLEDHCIGTPVIPELHLVETRDEVFGLLGRLVDAADRGQFPVVHFETHGASSRPWSVDDESWSGPDLERACAMV